MKKCTLLLVLIPSLCLAGSNIIFDENSKSSALVLSSNEYTTSCKFELSGLTTETAKLNEQDFVKALPLADELNDWGFTSEVGRPDLPVYSSMIIIPDQANVRVNINSSSYEVYDNIDIAPLQPWVLESGEQEAQFAQDEDFYQQNEFYPANLVSVNEPAIMRDFRFIRAEVHPMQYNPATRQLRVYTSIDYDLVYEGISNVNVKHRRNNNISDSFVEIYRNMFDNAEDVLTDYQPIRGGYLIIAPNNYNFADTIATLAKWKHLKGYYSTVVSSDEITPSGSPTFTQVYDFIENAYNTWEVPPDYVLIVGDEDQRIPDYPYGSYSSDHQYSTVDGDDYYSDVLLARLSIDSMTELRVAMKKILRYEQDPDMSEPAYWKRGLGVAGNISATSPRITNLWVRELAMDHGYTQVDTVFDWGSGAPNWNTIPQAINNGVSYVSYRGWAGSSGWYNPDYRVDNIGQLTNGWKLGIMASIVCGTGNFGSNICFGEAWIRSGSVTLPKGGVSFYGCSDGNTHTAWNNPNMVGFFWALFEQDMYRFGQLMYMGKLRLAQAYPSLAEPGGTVNQYFNTYNSLGDPELQVRTEIPLSMTVTHPTSLPYGINGMAVNVTANGGGPLEGAYVNLVQGTMGSETIYEGAYTDASGQAIFEFDNPNSEAIYITVTARDYIPYQGECQINQQAVTVGINTISIHDQSGNNDSEANPGEEIGLGVVLHNYGNSQNATNVSATISTDDDRIAIITGSLNYNDIAYGQDSNIPGDFVIEIDNSVPHAERLFINLNISSTQGSWQSLIPVDVVSVKPTQLTTSFPDIPGDVINPGQTADLVIDIFNSGGLDGVGITGELVCEDDYITILDNAGSFGNINAGEHGNNAANPFRIMVSNEAYNGRNVNFKVNFTCANPGLDNVQFNKVFSIVIGTVNSFDPVGPDNHGYYIYDNTDLGYSPVPLYDWIEINPNSGGQGTRLSIASDDGSVLFDPPFDITYYGEDYSQMIISTNGFVAFDLHQYDAGGSYWHNWDNWPIPDYGNARAQISPFWDDLEYSGNNNGIYTYYDTTEGSFIIEWSGCNHARTSSPETFQIIFYETRTHPTPTGDCEIVFQYKEINNDDFNNSSSHPEAYSSVGMENYAQDDGLQYQYDNIYHPGATELVAGLALKITTATGMAAPPDMSYSPGSFDMAAEPGDAAEDHIYINNNGDGYLFYTIAVETMEDIAIASIPAPESVIPEPHITKGESYTGPYNPPMTLDNGGPDNFGYTWADSDEPGGPVYNWIDITGIGTRINGLSDESNVGPFPIGFEFNYYGNSYTTFRACSNGYCTFGDNATVYENTQLPNTANPNNMLAVYWDDMNFESVGSAYYYNNGVDSCVISYVNVPHYQNDGQFTFQIILLRSGKIIYQYKTATGPDVNQSTVGIENSAGNDGLQVCYYSPYIQPPMAIEFSAKPRWLLASPIRNTLEPHTCDTIEVICDAADLEIGSYEGVIHMTTNDNDYPAVDFPVNFEVFQAGQCDYIPGDINGDGSVSAADITYGAEYMKNTGPVPPDSCWNASSNSWLYAAGDVNGNCAFLGSDISYLVKYFREQRPAPSWCPETPPPAHISGKANKGVSKRLRGSKNNK